MSSENVKDWTVEIRMAGVPVPGASISVLAAQSGFVTGLGVAFAAGDAISVFHRNDSPGNNKSPLAVLSFEVI